MSDISELLISLKNIIDAIGTVITNASASHPLITLGVITTTIMLIVTGIYRIMMMKIKNKHESEQAKRIIELRQMSSMHRLMDYLVLQRKSGSELNNAILLTPEEKARLKSTKLDHKGTPYE